MNQSGQTDTRLIAVDPTTKGFGFVVFEGEDMLVDLGTVEVSGRKNPACLEVLGELLDRYLPDVLVLEEGDGPGSRRRGRILGLLSEIKVVAGDRGIETAQFSRKQIRSVFGEEERPTKEEIAHEIAERYRALEHRLPPERKPWMSEPERMALFDATSLAIAYFEITEESASGSGPVSSNRSDG